MNKEVFEKWLEQNTALSQSTIGKYMRAIRTISSEMNERNLVEVELYNINNASFIESVIHRFENHSYFQRKDERGNRMYSNALKYYREFLLNKKLRCE